MDERLKSLEREAGKRRDLENPPLELWNPPLSGDIPIRISGDGRWYHDGGEIKRATLVRLFASILRREDDGDYYLVTPVEKWRIQVERHALMVVDIERSSNEAEELTAILNTGRRVVLDEQHGLYLDNELEGVAAITLDHGLSGLLTRAAWYRLVEMASDVEGVPTVVSRGVAFPLFHTASD